MTFAVDSCALLSCRLFSTFFIRRKFLCLSSGSFHMDSRDEAKSAMEIVNVPPIVSVYRQALLTFERQGDKNISTNLSKLKTLMDGLKAEDFSFDKTLSDPVTWRNPNKAPCTYIEVYKNPSLIMNIFVLKPGFKMPLHDHPHMHGLLKVIAGAVRIRSFSEYPLDKSVNMVEFERQAIQEAERLSQGIHKCRKLFAQVKTNTVCRQNSGTCLLTPTISNYHEIEALEMPAAFFDILAPPYADFGPRQCHYYEIANEVSTNVVELKEIDVPECFHCDQAPYLGPILT